MLFYVCVALAQHFWDTLEESAVKTSGKKIMIATGLGRSETGSSILFASQPGGFAGLIGFPAAVLELKLALWGRKIEAK